MVCSEWCEKKDDRAKTGEKYELIILIFYALSMVNSKLYESGLIQFRMTNGGNNQTSSFGCWV